MRTDIYVVQNNEQEGIDLIKWCKEQELPIDTAGCNELNFYKNSFDFFCYRNNGFNKNDDNAVGNGKTQVTIEEFKTLQLESLGKTNSEELTILPDEGCFYGTPEQQTAFAKFLCTRPFCRADGKITKDEAIGIGWNKTSHWWLKTKNSQKQEYNFQQLRSFIKVLEEPQFEAGKWYQLKASHLDTKWYLKLTFETNDSYKGEYINAFEKQYGEFGEFFKSLKYKLIPLTNLSEIQEYLPDGHVDKVIKKPFLELSFWIRYSSDFTEDLFNAFFAWAKINIGEHIRTDTPLSFDKFKNSCWNHIWVDVNEKTLLTDYKYCQDNNCQTAKEEWDISKLKSLINYVEPKSQISEPVKEWMPKVGDWIYAKRSKDDFRRDEFIPVFKLEEINNRESIWLRPTKGESKGVILQHCRPATQDEIPKEPDLSTEKLPEYVECIGLMESEVKGWNHMYTIGQIYKLKQKTQYGNYEVLIDDVDSRCCDKNQFKPSTKEAFDNQFKPKYEVVHCKTQEEWDFVTKTLGYVWIGGNWNTYKENSCIDTKKKGYAGKEGTTYGGGKAKILSFEEWLNKEGIIMEKTESLLEEAKRRYPVGTKFKSARTGEMFTVASQIDNSYSKEMIAFTTVEKNESGNNWALVYLEGKWAEIIQEKSTNESLVGRVVKRISYNTYPAHRNPAIGEYDVIQSDYGSNWLLKTFMNCAKDKLLEDFELMPIGFQIPLNEPSTNLEQWLKETKAKNLSLEELMGYIDNPETCNFDNIFTKLKGEADSKAEILWNEWNKPDISLKEEHLLDFEENHYPSMSETPKFAPSTDFIIKQKPKINTEVKNINSVSINLKQKSKKIYF